jgi:hypothetical protein
MKDEDFCLLLKGEQRREVQRCQTAQTWIFNFLVSQLFNHCLKCFKMEKLEK